MKKLIFFPISHVLLPALLLLLIFGILVLGFYAAITTWSYVWIALALLAVFILMGGVSAARSLLKASNLEPNH